MNLTYQELVDRWKSLRARPDGVCVREVACVGVARTLLCAELGDATSPAIALSAGVHGDEPAGVFALLQLLENAALDSHYSYRIWPCTNPTGFALGTRASQDGTDLNRSFGRGGSSPEARAILTANRDRRFALSIDLHEDADAVGFYCYEYGTPPGPGSTVGRSVVRELAAAGWPIDALDGTFETAGPLRDQACEREPGRIAADAAVEAALLGGLSYSLALARKGGRALTFETPAGAALADRVAMHVGAVRAAIAALRTAGQDPSGDS